MRHGHFQDRTAGQGKRERTRSALLDAAIAVVAEKGMEAAKISDITTAAGLANGTFYNHFNDKDEILREAAYGIAFEVVGRLDAEMEGIDDAAIRVVTATTRFVSILTAERDWAAVLLGGADRLPDFRENLYRYLRADIERGVAQKKFDVEVTTFLLDQIVALIGVAVRAQLHDGQEPEITRQVCGSILRLLGMTPARAAKLVPA
ncbi:transcriptional regulator, TetR family [Parvibaculum lavamentivorans DS-1]|uniref:Transcriptional regulator, TetR family n=1 Tax=Parvibaculum lavamentivorans (strain DS-1 / DSM 13023 / NCIMB 13966) TaxID=402881 RepID=A7HPC2_PARL1|nr:TetR/AcrR family transcriptional regulator [Parvibaculum lavamentivorans]ABS61755.1 transcriptional regulator, TetR family [Parvibaculum lavamentivorans DS-1]